MKNKICLFMIFLFIPILVMAELNVFFNCNRFPAQGDNTQFEITFKVFDADLDFAAQDNVLAAQLLVNFDIFDASGQGLYHKDFVRQINVDLDKTSIYHGEFFIDKIRVTVTPGLYKFKVDVEDRVNSDNIVWEKTLNTLDFSHMNLSDIEISSFHKEDTTSSFLDFKRGPILFLVNPNHLFDPSKDDGFSYYFNVFKKSGDITQLLEGRWIIDVLDENQKSVYNEEEEFTSISSIEPFWHWVPISNWEQGTYTFSVKLYSEEDKETPVAAREELIFIHEDEESISKAELDKEYRYAKYFLTNYEDQLYGRLDDEGRIEFLKRFWEQNDPNPKTAQNEFKEDIIQRVNYTNRNFAHYGVGWNTDRGRIYIRNGKPEEVIDKSYEYDAKPYIIWKYYLGGKRIYVFVDFTKLGNYKLVYSENDELEFGDPNWEDYMGPYFDENELQ